MVTRKKVEVVKATKTPRVKKEKPPVVERQLTDVEMAMKLGAVFIRYGSHLTVSSYPDGTVKLAWDDEALLKEVREAIASVETK